MLIFFIFLIFILSLYSMHRYIILYLYRKYYKSKKIKIKKVDLNDKDLPIVLVQIPLYNEVYVVRRVIDSVANLKYPKEKLWIQILDDSTDETSQIALEKCKELKKKEMQISYIHRDNRKDFKAGALQIGLTKIKTDLVAIFDADFTPLPDFLLEVIAYFSDPKVAFVQTRWAYLNSKSSLLTRAQKISLDAHFQLEHTARNCSGRFINFNGTGVVLRKSAIINSGGWQGDTLTEDLDLSYRMQLKGYKALFLPHVQCPSELPEDIESFKSQQFRWTKGTVQVALKILPDLLRHKISWKIKIEAIAHLCAPLTYVISSSLIIIFPIFSYIVDTKQYIIYWLAFIYVFVLLPTGIYYLYGQKETEDSWFSSLAYYPFIISTGVLLSFNNVMAILEALFKKDNTFMRTPKYNVETSRQLNPKEKKIYHVKIKYFLWIIELFFTIYMNYILYSIIQKGEWFKSPLLIIFAMGYNYNFYLYIQYILKRIRIKQIF